MQLSYRGVCYQRLEPVSEMIPAETTGIYRDISWYKDASHRTKIPYAIARLTYRGVHYVQMIWTEVISSND